MNVYKLATCAPAYALFMPLINGYGSTRCRVQSHSRLGVSLHSYRRTSAPSAYTLPLPMLCVDIVNISIIFIIIVLIVIVIIV